MSVATFAMAAASGIEALLYLDTFGIGGRTDGLFVALGLYATFGVFSQSIRITAAPLLVGEDARLSPRELAIIVLAIALPVAVVTIPLASSVMPLLAPGLTQGGREVAETALPLFGGAMVLQLWAAAAATVLAVRNCFSAIARAYAGGAGVGFVVYLATQGPAGELSLAWSMLAMAVVTCTLATVAAMRSKPVGPERRAAPLRLGSALAKAPLVLGRTLIYFAFNGLYVITVAFVSRAQPGDATILSYVYLFASYMVAGTAFALGMGRIAEMRRAVLSLRPHALVDTVAPGYRYSIAAVAPALAILVICVPSVAGALLPGSLNMADVDQLRLFGLLIVPWTLAALAVNLLLPAMLALGRARFVNVLALPLLAVQVIASSIGSAAFGAAGAVGAFFVAPACFAVVLAAFGSEGAARGLGASIARDTARFGGVSVLAYGTAAAVAFTVTGGLSAALIAGAIGSVAYLLALPRVAPRETEVVVGAILRRRARPAEALA
jgi:hypothetical protein